MALSAARPSVRLRKVVLGLKVGSHGTVTGLYGEDIHMGVRMVQSGDIMLRSTIFMS